MARLVVTNEDLGTGLKVENNKVVVDVAALTLPVDVHVENATYDEESGLLSITFAGGKEPVTVDLATALGLNTKLKSVSVTLETGMMVITDTDGTEFRADLAPFVKLAASAAISQCNAYTDSKRGEEIMSLGGVKLGYLVNE